MKTHTYIPSYSMVNRDIGRIFAEVYHHGRLLQLNVRFLETGNLRHKKSVTFDHPTPIFSRLFLFRKGSAVVKTPSATYRLSAGMIYLLPAGLPFHVTYTAPELTFFHLRIDDYMGISAFENANKLLAAENRDLFDKICVAYDSQKMLRLEPIVFEAITGFVEPFLDELRERYDITQSFSPMLNYIHNTPPAKIQIEELAEIMKMSRAAVSKSFRRKVGISIKGYLQNYLLQKSREMLLFSDMTVSQIAQELGYSSSQYFHRVFRQSTGIPPSEYKALHPKMR